MHFRGLLGMKAKPDLVVLFHVNEHRNVVQEAKLCGIPVISVVVTLVCFSYFYFFSVFIVNNQILI